MARQDDIEDLLRQLAPPGLAAATNAQASSAALGNGEWMRRELPRTASVNQVVGTARWRLAGDVLVASDALPKGVEVSTTDKDHNQGRYYLRASALGVLITIRREPHEPTEQPKILQMQMESLLEQCPVAYDDQVVVYLAVPPQGHAPMFEVTTRGQDYMSYRLADLIDDRGDDEHSGVVIEPPRRPSPGGGAKVRSKLDRVQEGEGPDSSG